MIHKKIIPRATIPPFVLYREFEAEGAAAAGDHRPLPRQVDPRHLRFDQLGPVHHFLHGAQEGHRHGKE